MGVSVTQIPFKFNSSRDGWTYVSIGQLDRGPRNMLTQPKVLLRRILHMCGIDMHRYVPAHDVWYRRLRILEENRISLALDVGAHFGEFGLGLRTSGYRGRLVSFEPIAESFLKLRENAASDDKWDCYQVALGEADGSAEMHVAGISQSSSILPMLDRHVIAAPESAYVRSELITVTSLDHLRPELTGCDDEIYLKMDVQGYEMQVLRGAANTMSQVRVVETEMSLVPLYGGQVLIREMIDYLTSAGFDLVSCEREFVDPRSAHVLQVDGIFVRRCGT